MSFTISPQMRMVAIAGVVALLALGGGVFFLGSKQPAPDSAPSASPQELIRRANAKKGAAAPAPVVKKPEAQTRPVAKPRLAVKAKPAPAPKPAPTVSLYQNLPAVLLSALTRHELVVTVLYNPQARDDQIAVAEAQAGAADARVGFAGLNVLDQRDVGQITRTYGLINDPAVLVFRRPGVVVGRLDGFADRLTVAQAVDQALAS